MGLHHVKLRERRAPVMGVPESIVEREIVSDNVPKEFLEEAVYL